MWGGFEYTLRHEPKSPSFKTFCCQLHKKHVKNTSADSDVLVRHIMTMTRRTFMRMFSGFTSLWKMPQLQRRKPSQYFYSIVSREPECFLVTCACVQGTCKVGTCRALLYDQAEAFFFLQGIRTIMIHNWHETNLQVKNHLSDVSLPCMNS